MIDINLGGPLIELGSVELTPWVSKAGLILRRAGNRDVAVLGLNELECTLLGQHLGEPIMVRLWAPGAGDGEQLAKGIGAMLKTMREDERDKFFQELRQHFCFHCGADDPRCTCTRDE